MARGGYRPGAGRKPNPIKPKTIATPKLRATVAAEPKTTELGPAIDPAAWAMMLPEIEEISRKYATNKPRIDTPHLNPFQLPTFPEKALPPRKDMRMAMDQAMTFGSQQWMAGAELGGLSGEGLLFLGFTFLAELAQRPEYRVISETIADDATRRWIDFDVTGDEKKQEEERKKDPAGFDERMADPDERKKRVAQAGKTDKVKALKDDQLQLEVQQRFYEQARNDGFFGRSHLFLDIRNGADPTDEELKTPIGDGRDDFSKGKVGQGSFKALKTIEPVWTYPLSYNAINPLRYDWYNPQVWFVMGKEIHGSRLRTFVGHPVPDMLKPAYSFGGLSLSQMAKPYVDIWLQTRQSVSQLIHSFSVMVLMTDLSTLMAPNNVSALLARVAMFNMLRDNQGTFVVNKNTEDFKNVSAQLGGLHELQSQAQEHMASVSRIPLVKLTGIQPAGLNASSEGEIKVYDDTIMAYQTRFFRPDLQRVINFEQLSLFGEVDPEITWHFEKLREITAAEKGTKEKDDADRNQKYVDMGALAPAEVRKIIIDDPDLPYTGLDPEDVPDLKEEEEEGLEPEGGRPNPLAGGEGDEGGGANDADLPFGATDGDWREDDHPRAENGQFGSGGSGGGKPSGKMPPLPDFLKATGKGTPIKSTGQSLKMPQFGLTPTPWQSHQHSSGFKLPERKPMPKTSGNPKEPGSLVAFVPGEKHQVKTLNGVAFKSWEPSGDWANVEGQAKIEEPPAPELPEGMTLSSGVIIQEPDGRVWLMRPKGGFGGYDQTFPKGGVEDGLSMQANAIKEAWEETGLQVKITGFAGDHEGDTTVSRFYTAERVGGDPGDAGWEAEGVILSPPSALEGLLNRSRDKAIAAGLSPAAQPTLDPEDLKKVGGKMGSNEGGTFEDKAGNKFYVKRPQSKDHVKNELAAARLYQLAGVNTLNYREVKGGNHVATELVKLDKNNVSKLTPAERAEATKDFGIHAWLSNYDAVGTGGDNQGVVGGKVTTLDVGGALKYRAQGAPKAWWGPKVGEIDSMRDPKINHDGAKLFGKMTDAEIKQSVERVTSISDAAIQQAAGDKALGDMLIKRKADLAKRFSLQAADAAFEESKHPRDDDGKFSSTGGGGGGGSTPAFKTKKEHAAHLLQKGTTTQEMLKALSWPSISMPQMAKTLGMKLEKIKEGGVTKYKGTPMTAAEIAAEKGKAAIAKQTAAQEGFTGTTLAEYGKAIEAATKAGNTQFVENIAKYNPDLAKQYAAQKADEAALKEALLNAGIKPKPTAAAIKAHEAHKLAHPEQYGLPAKSKHAPPTTAELEKAKKNVKLQLQYVPGAPQTPEAQKLVDQFNKTYEGKVLTSPADLTKKVDAFKDLQAAMIPLMSGEQKKQAEAAQKAKAQAEITAKAQAAQYAKDVAEAAKKNKDVIEALGISPQQAEGVVELAKMLGSKTGDLVEKFKSYAKAAENYGYPITGFQAALISNYSDGGYHEINKALRSGAWTPAQHAYVAMVNKALMAMPKHTGGGLTRHTSLTADQQKGYLQGHIVQEHALMSTSTGSVFSGNTTFKVTGIGKRGASIQKLSNHAGEKEVLFAAKTYFKVNKVEGTPGGKMVIHLEEWEEHV
jgi:8-oxo-dGTP pyrophosphatase MutT (NUDIX family)